MDYMELVKKSVSNAWKYKFLWLFGFFVAATDGAGSHWWTNRLEEKDVNLGQFEGIVFEPAFLAVVGLALFSLWIVFWVMGVLSEGSLIHGITKKEMNHSVSFAECWSAGVGKFFRLFGIILLATLAVVFVVISLIMFIIPSYIAFVGLGVLLTILAIPILLAVILVVISIEGWAIRFAVLNDTSWLDAIGQGWHLFKNNVGKTLAVAFASFFAQFFIWCGLVVGMLILAVPFVLIGTLNLWLGLIPGVFLALVIIILSSGFFGTLASSMWTLGFIKLTGYTGQPGPVAGNLTSGN